MSNLILKHNSGFFSCCSVAVYDIITHIKTQKSIPDVDFSQIFGLYKGSGQGCKPDQDAYKHFFKFDCSQSINIEEISNCNYEKMPHLDYRLSPLEPTKPIIKRWFTPSDTVQSMVGDFCDQYNIDPQKTIGIFFRGTDKYSEVAETPYDIFTSQVHNLLDTHKDVNRVFLQTDQQQFIDYFQEEYPDIDSFYIKEHPTTTTKRGLHLGIIKKNKILYTQIYFAALLILSKCKVLINHTGNGARWAIEYRGNTDNAIQYRAGDQLR